MLLQKALQEASLYRHPEKRLYVYLRDSLLETEHVGERIYAFKKFWLAELNKDDLSFYT